MENEVTIYILTTLDINIFFLSFDTLYVNMNAEGMGVSFCELCSEYL
jgi:hypothetical protein